MKNVIQAAMEELEDGLPYVGGEEAAQPGDQIELIEHITELCEGNDQFVAVSECYDQLNAVGDILARTDGRLSVEQAQIVFPMIEAIIRPTGMRPKSAALEALETATDEGRFQIAMEGIGEMLAKAWNAIVDFIKGVINWVKRLFGFGSKSSAACAERVEKSKEIAKEVKDAESATGEDRAAKIAKVKKRLPSSTATDDNDEPIVAKMRPPKKTLIKTSDSINKALIKSVGHVNIHVRDLGLISANQERVVSHEDIVKGLQQWVQFTAAVQDTAEAMARSFRFMAEEPFRYLAFTSTGKGTFQSNITEDWNKQIHDTLVLANKYIDRYPNVSRNEGKEGRTAREAEFCACKWSFQAVPTSKDDFNVPSMASFFGLHGTEGVKVRVEPNAVAKAYDKSKQIVDLSEKLYKNTAAMIKSQSALADVLAKASDSHNTNLIKGIKNDDARDFARSFVIPAVNNTVRAISAAFIHPNAQIAQAANRAVLVANNYNDQMFALMMEVV